MKPSPKAALAIFRSLLEKDDYEGWKRVVVSTIQIALADGFLRANNGSIVLDAMTGQPIFDEARLHPDCARAQAAIRDYMLGKPQENVALEVSNRTTIEPTPEALALMGLRMAKFSRERDDGTTELVEVTAITPGGGDGV